MLARRLRPRRRARAHGHAAERRPAAVQRAHDPDPAPVRGRRAPLAPAGGARPPCEDREHADRDTRTRRQPDRPGLPRPGGGSRQGPDRRPDGTARLHRVLPPAPHGPRADGRPALLPRRPTRLDRRARDDADERRRPDDPRSRPRLAAGSRRRRDPRVRHRRARHRGGVRTGARGRPGAGGRRPPAGGRRRRRRPPHPRERRQGARLRPSRAQAARPAGRADPRARGRARRRRPARRARAVPARERRGGLGEAAHDERVGPDGGGHARPRASRRRP